MSSSTLFKSNRTQAVRLPKAVAFPNSVHCVDIVKAGSSRIVTPKGQRWDDLFENGQRSRKIFCLTGRNPQAR